MTMQEATYLLLKKLRGIYPEGEASQVTDWVMEHLTGSKKTERMLYKNEAITASEESQLKEYIKRMLAHEPVQYVLNEAWFCGQKFYVDKNVLIPRPETEELVEWISSGISSRSQTDLSLLDIGTGSGCIPVILKKKFNEVNVSGCDSSVAALEVAGKNAGRLGTGINFLELDFLQQTTWDQLPLFDIIVSNPPYIANSERHDMRPNVLQYEPAAALFVPDNDPLVFYRAIAEFGRSHLKENGTIYAEINESLGDATQLLFETNGYKTELKKDMQGKDRMIKAMPAKPD